MAAVPLRAASAAGGEHGQHGQPADPDHATPGPDASHRLAREHHDAAPVPSAEHHDAAPVPGAEHPHGRRSNQRAFAQNASVALPQPVPAPDTATARGTRALAQQPASVDTPTAVLAAPSASLHAHAEPALRHTLTPPSTLPPARRSSLPSAVSASSPGSSLSPASGPSPSLAALADLTPLPSPLVGNDSPALWRRTVLDLPAAARPNVPSASPESPSKRKKKEKEKGYGSLMQEAAIASAQHGAGGQEPTRNAGHARNRSVSAFQPEPLHNTRPRHVTYGPGDAPHLGATEYQMHREAHLAEQRGVIAPATPAEPSKHLPTPPASTSSAAGSDEADEEPPHLEDGTVSEYLEIHCGIHNQRRKFRQLRRLGQGTFSTVVLATREKIPAHPTPDIEEHLDARRLVAIKIMEHGPAGGADEERIEVSLKREVEMLKSVSHPSLIHLKACEYQESRALLVLTYCPGGDLFELASQKRELLRPRLIQRMFAELVSAVRYLHSNWIVHRDIKLENVLVNLREPELRALHNPTTHPTPIVTLTDMGLSRRIPEPPKSPSLTTRCGSEDYAAPEILLGQPYDGRLTDGWALGVLLYALMEGRLPFDAPPGKPDRSRNTYRIARCDWIWCRFGDEDGEWDPARGQEFEGAQACVEGLLKKVRMGRKPLPEIEQLEWVEQGVHVPGGLRTREEDGDHL